MPLFVAVKLSALIYSTLLFHRQYSLISVRLARSRDRQKSLFMPIPATNLALHVRFDFSITIMG
jgi:hypothetical protein